MTSTIFILKNLERIPKNGFCIFAGLVSDMNDSKGKQKKIAFGFEPLQPLKHGLYHCDNKFHTQDLISSMGSNGPTFGICLINGDGSLFATLNENNKEVLHVIKDPNLPKKHNKGGQSSVRFARLREEARFVYLKKIAELITKLYIKNDLPIVKGIILGGSGNLKYQLLSSGLLDQRIAKIVIKVSDTAYGGEIGFNQLVEQNKDLFSLFDFMREKVLIQEFMNEISRDSKKCVFTLRDTMEALENGNLKKIIVWQDLPYLRVVSNDKILFLKSGELEDCTEKQKVLDYLIEKKVEIELISGNSVEGNQFINGFGGIAGYLYYDLQLDSHENNSFENDLKEESFEGLEEFQ